MIATQNQYLVIAFFCRCLPLPCTASLVHDSTVVCRDMSHNVFYGWLFPEKLLFSATAESMSMVWPPGHHTASNTTVECLDFDLGVMKKMELELWFLKMQ